MTSALGAGVFVTATHTMAAETTGDKPAAGTAVKTPPHKKVFIALPGDRYYAVPEDALAPFKVALEQFNAELATKQAAETKAAQAEEMAERQTESRGSKAAGIDLDEATRTEATAEELADQLRKKLQKKMEAQQRRNTAVAGVRG